MSTFRLSRVHGIIPASILLLALSGCHKSNPEIHGGNSQPVRVKVLTAASIASGGSTSSTNALSDGYSGTIEAGASTTPSFSVPGTITKIAVSQGDRVAKGQLIATIDGSSLKNTYEIALATLREAQDAYSRLKKLHDANALPDMQWVAVQERLKQAEAAANIAHTGMNDANLYAPISGVVSRKIADVGQNVGPGVPVVELLDVTTLKAKINVPEADLAKLNTGAPATVTAGGKTYAAKLTEKGVAANTLSRNYDVKFLIAGHDENLLPGMICTVNVDGAAPSVASSATGVAATPMEIVLPPQAVVLDWDNTHYVWVMRDGKARRVKVSVAGLDSRGIVVDGGLTGADSVIIEGQQKLSNGLNVVAVN